VSQTVQGNCWIVCESLHCGVIGPMKPTPVEAAAAWNTRVLSETGHGERASSTDMSPAMTSETVLPVEMESRLIGDMAAFRASEVELVEAFDFTRPCLGRAHDRIAGDLILVQVSGALQGGFAWAYAKRHAALAEAAQSVNTLNMVKLSPYESISLTFAITPSEP